MNFYINAVNNILKTEQENDTIGLILDFNLYIDIDGE